MSLPPCCPYHPAGVSCRIGQPAPCHAAFAPKEWARPPDLYFVSRPLLGSLALQPGDLLTIPKMALSVGFIRFVFFTDTTQARGLLTFPPVGLPPHTEHVCLSWTHSLAKIENAFKVNSIRGRCVTCYMDEDHGLAQFSRTTRDRWSFW
jgi:hypothetical protein